MDTHCHNGVTGAENNIQQGFTHMLGLILLNEFVSVANQVESFFFPQPVVTQPVAIQIEWLNDEAIAPEVTIEPELTNTSQQKRTHTAGVGFGLSAASDSNFLGSLLDAMNPFKFPWDLKPGINPLFDSPKVPVPILGDIHLFNPLTHTIATLLHSATILPLTLGLTGGLITIAGTIGTPIAAIVLFVPIVALATLINGMTYRGIAVIVHEVLKTIVPLPFNLARFV